MCDGAELYSPAIVGTVTRRFAAASGITWHAADPQRREWVAPDIAEATRLLAEYRHAGQAAAGEQALATGADARAATAEAAATAVTATGNVYAGGTGTVRLAGEAYPEPRRPGHQPLPPQSQTPQNPRRPRPAAQSRPRPHPLKVGMP